MCNVLKIESISDLEKMVLSWEKQFLNPGQGFPPVWYRGQPRDLPPQPGILRKAFLESCESDELQFEGMTGNRLWDKERSINRQFRRMAASHLPAGLSLVSLYLLAQHHGLPTRMLDWSANPLAALFFATSGRPEEDGVIYVMNAKNLGSLTEMRDSRVEAAVQAVFGDGEIQEPESIIPLLPDLHAGRLLHQSSCFTLHTPPRELNNAKVAEIAPLPVLWNEKWLVPQAAKHGLLLTLRRLGVNYATLFQDIDHVAKELKCAWKL